MKILIVNYEYPPLGGGGGVATKELAEELAKKHTVHVLTSSFEDLPRKEVTAGVVIHRAKVFGRNYKATASVLSMLTFLPTAFIVGAPLCLREKFTVINAQFVLPSGAPAVLLSILFRIPFVLSFIGGDVFDPSKGISPHRHGILRVAIRLISKFAVRSTAISSDTKSRVVNIHGVTSPITITPIGLVSREYDAKDRDVLGLPAGLLAVSIGRLIPRKGFETLLEAWKAVPDASLAIIGTGPLKRKLTDMIEEFGLSDRVFLLGSVSNERKHQVLKEADLYVSAAQHEGFGIVFLEAMKAGLPIVAPVVGGQTDFLRNKENALLVDSLSSDDIASAVTALVGDSAMRDEMGKRNLRDVDSYSIKQTTAIFESVLTEAITDYENRN